MQAPPTSTTPAQPWYEKYPAPKHTSPVYVEKEVVAEAFRNKDDNFIILDLRRDDFRGGRIRGALNLPAQHIYPSISQVYDLAEKSGKQYIYVHCNSSGGRATRICGWLEDEQERVGGSVKPVILKGGFRAWIAGGPEYIELMDEYDPSALE